MRTANRRDFLADVGRGMLLATLGPAVAAELGLASANAGEGADRLTFGKLEPLVALMQDTPAAKLLPVLVDKLHAGTETRTLVAAAALANARTFGGHDYEGYHAFMSLAPAYEMSRELPEKLGPLPILKVLYRNTSRMQRKGGSASEVLHPIQPAAVPTDRDGGELMREVVRTADAEAAERTLAGLSGKSDRHAYESLLHAVQDEIDVHRVVLAWRAWETLPLTGPEHAQTLLRQSVRFCVDTCRAQKQQGRTPGQVRHVLPKLLDQYKLLGRTPGDRKAEDGWIEKLSLLVYSGGRDRAAEAVAAALAEGMAPEDVGEAISLAANRLVLCDPGRTRAEANKPIGSVHGASVGVHASDSANAWRNIARVSQPRNLFASLIVGAYHTGGQHAGQHAEPYPPAERREQIREQDAGRLLQLLEAAVKEKDQAGASAVVHRYGAEGHAARPIFDVLLRYAISEDGALHAEKYYRTVTEEFARTRPAYRWRHLVALARVTASECGHPAPGYAEARRLLKA